MTFTLSLKNAKPFPAGAYFIRWTRTGDDGKRQEGKSELSAERPLVVKTSLDEPGFVRLTAEVVDAQGKLYHKKLNVDASTPEGKRALNRWGNLGRGPVFGVDFGDERRCFGELSQDEGIFQVFVKLEQGPHSLKTVMVDGVETKLESDMFAATKQA